MTSSTQGEIRPNSADFSAVFFDFSSPAVRQLPELLEVHRLVAYIHARLIELGDDLPLVLSGWVVQEAKAHLDAADAVLRQCAAVIARGAEHAAADREAGQWT